MKIDFGGRSREVDTSVIGLQQAVVITERLGLSLSGWEKALMDTEDPKWLPALQCLYWLMLQQNDEIMPLADVDFPVLKFAEAWADAMLAEQAEQAPAAEPDPTPLAVPNGEAVPPQPVPAVTG